MFAHADPITLAEVGAPILTALSGLSTRDKQKSYAEVAKQTAHHFTCLWNRNRIRERERLRASRTFRWSEGDFSRNASCQTSDLRLFGSGATEVKNGHGLLYRFNKSTSHGDNLGFKDCVQLVLSCVWSDDIRPSERGHGRPEIVLSFDVRNETRSRISPIANRFRKVERHKK